MRLLIAGLLALVTADPAIASPVPPSLQAELSRLESQKWRHGFSNTDRKHLIDLYFLLSRCNDVKLVSLKAMPTEAGCWCGAACPPGTSLNDVVLLRSVLEKRDSKKPVKLSSPNVKKLWIKLRSRPDARYLVYRFLTRSSAVDAALRSELEKDLAALEVHHK